MGRWEKKNGRDERELGVINHARTEIMIDLINQT